MGTMPVAHLWAIDINPLRLTLELGEKFNPYKQFKIPAPNIDVIRSAELIGIPLEYKNNQLYIKSLGIALSAQPPSNLKEEFINRQLQYLLFTARHSAPLKGLDGFESHEILENLAFGLNPVSQHSESHDLLFQYAMTDYGAATLKKILSDSNAAIQNGFLLEDGTVTSRGKEALSQKKWAGVFIFGSTEYIISAGINSLLLPDHFRESFFPVGSEPVDRLALLHHEMGHTRFGLMSQASSKAFEYLEQDQLMLERFTVQQYENPVRTLNSQYYKISNFKERAIYFDNFNTVHIPSGYVFRGPAFIPSSSTSTSVLPSAFLYKYKLIDGQIHVNRDAQGLGIVDYQKEAYFYRVIAPSLPF